MGQILDYKILSY